MCIWKAWAEHKRAEVGVAKKASFQKTEEERGSGGWARTKIVQS